MQLPLLFQNFQDSKINSRIFKTRGIIRLRAGPEQNTYHKSFFFSFSQLPLFVRRNHIKTKKAQEKNLENPISHYFLLYKPIGPLPPPNSQSEIFGGKANIPNFAPAFARKPLHIIYLTIHDSDGPVTMVFNKLHRGLRPVLLQEERRYFDCNIWSIFPICRQNIDQI